MDLFSFLDSILSPSTLMTNCVERREKEKDYSRLLTRGMKDQYMTLFKNKEKSSEGLDNSGQVST